MMERGQLLEQCHREGRRAGGPESKQRVGLARDPGTSCRVMRGGRMDEEVVRYLRFGRRRCKIG